MREEEIETENLFEKNMGCTKGKKPDFWRKWIKGHSENWKANINHCSLCFCHESIPRIFCLEITPLKIQVPASLAQLFTLAHHPAPQLQRGLSVFIPGPVLTSRTVHQENSENKLKKNERQPDLEDKQKQQMFNMSTPLFRWGNLSRWGKMFSTASLLVSDEAQSQEIPLPSSRMFLISVLFPLYNWTSACSVLLNLCLLEKWNKILQPLLKIPWSELISGKYITKWNTPFYDLKDKCQKNILRMNSCQEAEEGFVFGCGQ